MHRFYITDPYYKLKMSVGNGNESKYVPTEGKVKKVKFLIENRKFKIEKIENLK